jgi:Tetratricopeptide repeat
MRVAPLLTRLIPLASIFFIGLSSLCFASDDLKTSYDALKAGHPDLALSKISDYLASHPKDAQARLLKGVILVESGKTAEAIQIFTSMTQEMPELPEPYNNLAVIYASQGDYEKAKTQLELALHTHPSYGTAHENLADIYAKIATQSFEKALQNDKAATPKPKLLLIKSISAARLPAVTPAASAINNSGIVAPEVPPSAVKPAPSVAASNSIPSIKPISPAQPINPTQPVKSASPSVAPEKASAAADSAAPKAISESVKSWAAAWSAKDAEHYLSFYGKGFKTPNGESFSEWEKSRRERLSSTSSIHVELQDLKITMEDNETAFVSFKQKYRSAQVKSSNHKILQLKREGGRWVIVEERIKS